MGTIAAACGDDLEALKERIAYKAELFEWCLRKAEKCIRREEFNDALAWSECAARVFTANCAPLASERLESNLLKIAQRLPVPARVPARDAAAPRRWLHVVDSYNHNGGHASMAQRWILSDLENNVHSVVLPFSQGFPVVEIVADAVRQSGGEVHTPPPGSSLLFCAEWLRNLAFAKADYVVLHVAEYNVVITTAFGVDGGPPVMLTNHAAHVFWAGVPVVDLVLNCRGSLLERQWTEQLRGIPRSATLPIPLIPRKPEEESFSPEQRAAARRALNVADDEVVLLSVGRNRKYNPMPGVDFIQAAKSILGAYPRARVFVVGLTEQERWKRAGEETGGRLVAPFGRQSDLSIYHAAADIYLEGFPFGSTTALLEAGGLGIPCVLAPAVCPPPFTTDGVATDDLLPRPATVADYVAAAQALVGDPDERRRQGRSLKESILAHHTGTGWRRYLAEVKKIIPSNHRVHPMEPPKSPAEELQYFWESYMIHVENNPLPVVFRTAMGYGLIPRLDLRMWRSYSKASRLRLREGRLQLIAAMVSSLLLPFCAPSARQAFHDRLIADCARGGAITSIIDVIRNLKGFFIRMGSRSLVKPADHAPTGNV